MARYEFGHADDDDLLVIDGVEYHAQPIGLKAMRAVLGKRASLAAVATSSDPEVLARAQDESLDAMIDMIAAAVLPEQRDQLRTQLEERTGLTTILAVVEHLTRGLSDLDPTRQASSSTGSPPTGGPSMDGAAREVSTPSG